MIVTSYFGIIITALTTDYYPRISAINKDNKALEQEFNKQSEVAILLVGALVIIFMFAMPLFIHIIYTEEFMPAISYLQYAVFGVLFTVYSNALGMILLAKQASEIFFYTATIGRIVFLTVSLSLFYFWGIVGLGIAAVIIGIFHLSFMSYVMWRKYNITMNSRMFQMLFIIIALSLCAFFIKELNDMVTRYLLGAALFTIYAAYATYQTKKIMNIDILAFIKRKISKR